MFMVNECYSLKHSRLSTVFQLSVLTLISVVLFSILHLAVSILSVICMSVVWLWFKRTARLRYLQHLDQSEWSLKFQNQSTTQRVHLEKMIQHHFYVVIYFQNKKHKSVLIWKDQLDVISWKRLLTHCHLH